MRTHHNGQPAYRSGQAPGSLESLKREIRSTVQECYGPKGASIQASIRRIRRELFADKLGRADEVINQLARL
jgi:hypothetical protein